MSAQPDILRRQPPQSLETERGILGAILIEPARIEIASQIIQAEDFYAEKHRVMFGAMLSLWEDKRPIDAITLAAMLKGLGKLEECGGPAYLTECATQGFPSAVAEYARIVRDKSLMRELASVANGVAQAAYEEHYSASAMMGEAERQLTKVFERAFSGHREQSQKSSVLEAATALLEGQHEAVIQTGFAALDTIAWLLPGDLVTLAGDTSAGKSTLAANIALTVARAGQGVAFFTYEMAAEQLNQRIICSMAQVPGDRGRWGKYSTAERERIQFSVQELRDLPMEIVWSRGYKPSRLKNSLRRLRRELKVPLRLMVVDYLQLMQSDKANRHRDQDYDDIMRALKDFAGEYGCVVLLVSQMNREASKRGEKIPPRLMDLKGSSSIEQYSDGIWFLWQPSANEKEIELLVPKNRNGVKGRVYLDHYPEYLRFESR